MDNTISNNTDTAPVVAAEIDASVKPMRKSLPTIARRQVLQGKHKKAGAPKLEVIGLHKNRKRGTFTKADIFDANGRTISMLTITKRIRELRKAGQLVVDLTAAHKHVGPGRPPEFFNFDLSKGKPATPRTRKPKVNAEAAPIVAPEPAPAVEVAPVAPVPEVAPAEAPAV